VPDAWPAAVRVKVEAFAEAMLRVDSYDLRCAAQAASDLAIAWAEHEDDLRVRFLGAQEGEQA
jgi:hypothetical protein